MISKKNGFQTLSRAFMSFHDTCILCLSVGFCDPSYCNFLQLPQALSCSHHTRHRCLHRKFHFSQVLDGFLVFPNFPFDEINTSQCSNIVKFWFCTLPLLFFFLLDNFWHSWPYFRAQIIRSGDTLDLCKSPGGPQISLKKILTQRRELRESCPWIRQNRSALTFQQSLKRFSRHTSRMVCVIPVTSTFVNGIGKDSSFGT